MEVAIGEYGTDMNVLAEAAKVKQFKTPGESSRGSYRDCYFILQ